MKYMLLMSCTKSVRMVLEMAKEDLEKFCFHGAISARELSDSGTLVFTAGLAWPGQAKMVHAGKTASRLLICVFPETKSFWPATGLLMWKTKKRRSRLRHESR